MSRPVATLPWVASRYAAGRPPRTTSPQHTIPPGKGGPRGVIRSPRRPRPHPRAAGRHSSPTPSSESGVPKTDQSVNLSVLADFRPPTTA